MPIGRAGKKKGKKAKRKEKAEEEVREMLATCRNFLKFYSINCVASESAQSSRIIRTCRESMEDEKPFSKFVMESSLAVSPTPNPKSPGPKGPVAKAQVKKEVPPESTAALPAIPSLPMLVQPLVKSLTESSYSYIRCLHVWGTPINDDGAVALSLFLESPLGFNLRVLELRDTGLSPWSVIRVSKTLTRLQLTLINLDYNSLPYDALAHLCDRLQPNLFVQTLSLNYCDLDNTCGDVLGVLSATSHIKYLSLVGNRLECGGCIELMRPVVALCESTACDEMKDFLAFETPDKDSKKESESGSGPEKLPLPLLAKLDLRDNAIDAHGVSDDRDLTFEPVICMRAVKRWMISSPILEEINFDHNFISDGGARELLHGLQTRKEAGLPVMKLIVTYHICPEIFEDITKLCSEKKKKGRKKKGKKKK